MRHQMANKKLGRTSAHRSALFRNQLASILESERIVTTLVKAKELRPIVEKMVTLGKTDSVHNRRQAARSLTDQTVVSKLFDVVAPRFASRPGGYTRIIKLGPRRGDGAEMAILEFVDYTLEKAPAEKPAAGKKAKAAPAEKKAEGEEKSEEAPKKKSSAKKAAAPKKAAAGEAKPKKTAAKKSSAKKKAE